MENGIDEKNNSWIRQIGRFLKLTYEDGRTREGSPHYSVKEGKLIYVTDTHLILEMFGGKELGIQKDKILRFESEQRGGS